MMNNCSKCLKPLETCKTCGIGICIDCNPFQKCPEALGY